MKKLLNITNNSHLYQIYIMKIMLTIFAIYITSNNPIYAQSNLINNNNHAVLLEDNSMYDSLRVISKKNWFFSKIYTQLIDEKYKSKSNINRDQYLYKLYKGKEIGNIIIKHVDVFGTITADTTKSNKSKFTDFFVKFHINTSDYIVKNNLFFKQGDKFDPTLISANERYLAQKPYIETAKIYVEPSFLFSDDIDLIVIIQDRWSIFAKGSYKNSDNYNAVISDFNFLGSGISFSTEFTPNSTNTFDYEFRLKNDNIAGSFFSGVFKFKSTEKENEKNIAFNRKFLTNKTPFAGGIEFSETKTLLEFDSAKFNDNYIDSRFWIGKTIQKYRSGNMILSQAVNISSHSNFEKEYVLKNKRYDFKTLYLIRPSFSDRNYFRTKYVYSYGTFEDIPFGFNINFTGGLERSTLRNKLKIRFYNSLFFARGHFLKDNSYYNTFFRIDGFWNKGQFEQGTLLIRHFLLSNLRSKQNIFFREFISTEYILGINRFSDEMLYAQKGNTSTYKFNGKQRLYINFEEVAFLPYNLYGFKPAVFTNANIGIIGSNVKNIFRGNYFFSIGGGIRIRNEHLLVKTFQLYLKYSPVKSHDRLKIELSIFKDNSLKIHNFSPSKPDIIEFE